ncbi:MAG: amino acid ABC transporter ATP-binding protein [bacterium]|nr:amino acid ABC transporter ATP-binding protein [bacterium]
MIEIKNLHKTYQKNEVLKGIHLTVNTGETLAIIGSSGSGKSTLLRSLNLLETPDEGTITIDDFSFDAKNINRTVRSEARKRATMVFQNFNLFENKTALENVTEALRVVQKIPKKEADAIGEEYLQKVGLLERKDYYPTALSGGQKQRVAIARALALKPKVILFDEPTSALDPELVQEVLAVIKKVAKEQVTMIIVTHEMDFARDVADEIAFMDGGKIVEVSPAKEFFTNSKNERVQQFLANYLAQFSYSI